MRIAYHVMSAPSPLGLLFVAATEKGLRYVEYLDRKSLKRAIASHAAENPGATWEPSVRVMRPLADMLEQYFCGAERSLKVPLDLAGSEFQLKVWHALLAIPYAETRSYGDIAKAIGEPKAARAVGLAANQNPIVVVVPCHRVIGADGKLVGYAGGVPRKKFLLALESRFRTALPLDGDHVIAPMHRKVARPVAAPARPAKAAAKKSAKPAAKAPRGGVGVTATKPKSVRGSDRGRVPAAAPRRRAAAAAAAPARSSRVRSR